MKVGIITHHGLPNCGANLQALSTSLALKRMGHIPVIIDYNVPEIEELYRKITIPEQYKKHEEFVREYLNVSDACLNIDDVKKVAEKEGLGAVISGSDAVLRLDKKRSNREDMCFPNPFWLTWAKELGIEKTGFVAPSSMGSNYFSQPKEVRKGIKDAIENLTYCGVRDNWTALMLKSCGVSKEKVNFCPDPVTQVVSNEMLGLIPEIERPAGKFVLLGTYEKTAPKAWVEGLIKLLKSAGYITVGFPQPDHPSKIPTDIEVPLPVSPLEWLAWLNASEGYIGVRFHPIVISQALGKPFVALDHYDNGIPVQNKYLNKASRKLAPFMRTVSKTYDLAKRVGLEEYVVPKRKINVTSPRAVFDLFESASSNITTKADRERRAKEFDNVLNAFVN